MVQRKYCQIETCCDKIFLWKKSQESSCSWLNLCCLQFKTSALKMCFNFLCNIVLRNLFKLEYSDHQFSWSFCQLFDRSHCTLWSTESHCECFGSAIFDLMNMIRLKYIIFHHYVFPPQQASLPGKTFHRTSTFKWQLLTNQTQFDVPFSTGYLLNHCMYCCLLQTWSQYTYSSTCCAKILSE